MKFEVCDLLIIFWVFFSINYSYFKNKHFLLFKPLPLRHHQCEPYSRNIMVHGMSIIESEIDEQNNITLHPTLTIFLATVLTISLGTQKNVHMTPPEKYASLLLQYVLCAITHGTFIFPLDSRLAPTNKITFIDKVNHCAWDLRIFSTRISISTKLFLATVL